MLPISLQLDDTLLKAETKDGFEVSEKRKKLWAVELDLMMKLDEVCNKFGISYFIDSGTLLGAVRHKGFIPWDDDIDVIMLREDYDRFLKLPKDTFEAPYFLQTERSDPNCLRPHAQIRNSATTAIVKKEGIDQPGNRGIFIDIFPLDRVSKFAVFRAIKLKTMRLYYTFITRAKFGSPGKSKLKNGVSIVLYTLFHRISNEKMMRVYHNMAKHCLFPDDKVAKMTFYPLHSLRDLEKKRIPQSFFSDTVRLPFEGYLLPAPGKWDKILKIYYGNSYMKPVYDGGAHGELIYDAERPYTKVIEELQKQGGLL